MRLLIFPGFTFLKSLRKRIFYMFVHEVTMLPRNFLTFFFQWYAGLDAPCLETPDLSIRYM